MAEVTTKAKRLDIVARVKGGFGGVSGKVGVREMTADVFVVLGTGEGDDGLPIALVGAVYNIICDDHDRISNFIIPLDELRVVEPYGGAL